MYHDYFLEFLANLAHSVDEAIEGSHMHGEHRGLGEANFICGIKSFARRSPLCVLQCTASCNATPSALVS